MTEDKELSMDTNTGRHMGRREFLTRAAATTAGLTIVRSSAVAGTRANSAIEVGLIGAGRRGCWIGNLFLQNGNYRFVAAADLFDDRLETAQKELKVPADRCYKGLQAYRELLSGKLDAVAVMSPPYCHAEQADAVITAGKHLYLAKPVATDVPGCKTIINAGKKAENKNLTFLVDFQTRKMDLFQEAVRRVHEGAIGTAVCGQVYYHTGTIPYKVPPVPGDPATRLRNWIHDRRLSGDIIVEQNVHATDVCDWLLQAHPVKAYGTGSRKGRTDWGDCWTHFDVIFWYPGGVHVSFSSCQFGATPGSDICSRVFGTDGMVDTHYRGLVTIRGKHPFKGGETPDTFKEGAIRNIKTFEQSVRSGAPFNNAGQSALSTLTTILGRTAAYRSAEVTWEEMMAADEHLDPGLEL